ncbi:MAG: potassium channel family protein [Candidatus Caldarchaeum sp.]|nr:potassium channel family protein [Candidatus Caldarchaeum sp.]MCX8200528.1 potassium channel family protein [Candidatus Caldarchaeum sp.]MDW8063182.1 potassium channel family protein [Candidatus Caldarchaeum sp.]MDW8434993.1 potassium channel family protein [Candidatus Caldarchaeum sp.]
MKDKREFAASALTLFSIALILVEYFAPLSGEEFLIVLALDGFVVLVLLGELVTRAWKSGKLGHYLLRHWYEVLASIPLAFFVFLETQTFVGVVIRGLRLSRLLRLFLVTVRTRKSLLYLYKVLKVSRFGYLFAASATVVFVGTVSAFLLEVGVPDSKIRDVGDAFWWALATVTTVGYGDVVPVTVAGRIIGSILMVTGIAIIGVFISSLGSALLSLSKPETSPLEEMKTFLKNKVDRVESLTDEELNELIELLKAVHEVNRRTQGR